MPDGTLDLLQAVGPLGVFIVVIVYLLLQNRNGKRSVNETNDVLRELKMTSDKLNAIHEDLRDLFDRLNTCADRLSEVVGMLRRES
jgi:hypothetical protein